LNLWRLLIVSSLVLIMGPPLLLPVVVALPSIPDWLGQPGSAQLFDLAVNTLSLILLTLVLVLPPGTTLALLLFRCNLPARRFFLFLFLVILFVPLPVFASGWQAALGPGSWLPISPWQFRQGQPWTEGLLPAAWVHAQAALPWVILIVGQSLLWVERDLEEDALLVAPAWRVAWFVTLRRSGVGLVTAALWVTVQVAGEIAVTDIFAFRTFAEVTYLIFAELGEEALPQAVVISLVPTVLLGFLLLFAGVRLGPAFPPVRALVRPPLRFSLGRCRWPAFFLVTAVGLVHVGIPLGSLLWRLGLEGAPPEWSVAGAASALVRAFHASSSVIYFSLLWCVITAVSATILALLVCWCLRGANRLLQAIVWSLLVAAWVIPGPVIGLGLKKCILEFAVRFPQSVLADLLWFRPSPLPLMWAHLIRILPFAVAIVWSVFRFMPIQLQEAAQLDGASPIRRLLHVVAPLTMFTLICTLLVSVALALGEVSAAKLATTPGIEVFTLVVFDRMHYGVGHEVASLCLLLIFFLALAGLEFASRAGVLGLSRRVH
jgi:iron(III) transport system permease protein